MHCGRHPLWGLVGFVLTLAAQGVWASDRAKEQRWAEQIVDFLVVGEAVWLQEGEAQFLGLFTEAATQPARGAVIVIHGIGVHPDWQDVVAPLRTGLPEHGWATLSIQMPVLANEAEVSAYGPLFAQVPARLDAAVQFLQERGYGPIVIAAHSLGAAMSASYLAQQGGASRDITAFVAVGMSEGHAEDTRMHTVAFLERIDVPMLDLYGSQDQEAVRSAPVRRTAGSARGLYDQQEVADADHFFRGKSEHLVQTVAQWLERSSPSSR